MRSRPCIGGIGLVTAFIAAAAAAQQPPVSTAPAPPPNTRVLTGEPALRVALQLFIEQERWEDVLRLVDALPEVRRASLDMQLVQAQAWRRLGKPQRALDIYRALLGARGPAQALRLELAQTFYEARDLVAAEYNFRLASSPVDSRQQAMKRG